MPWDETCTTLVFVDGRLEYELAIPAGPDQPLVTNLLSPGAASDGRIDMELGRHASADSNGFLALNSAFLDDGAVVVAGQGARGVVHLVFVSSDNSEPQVTYPRSLVVAGPNSELTLLESYVGIGEGGYFTNSVTEVTLEGGCSGFALPLPARKPGGVSHRVHQGVSGPGLHIRYHIVFPGLSRRQERRAGPVAR